MPSSLPDLHRSASERLGCKTALRYKRHGVYHDLNWHDYREQADAAAAGLLELGIQPGDRIVILSENRYEWFVADHATLSTAAVNVPLHAPLAPKQVAFQVGHSESRGVLVSGQAQADKVFEVLDELPNVEFLISFDPIEPPVSPVTIKLLTFDGLKQRGRVAGAAAIKEIARRENGLTSDDLATIIYTSGTTGNPKGVMLTHGNLLSNAKATGEVSYIQRDDVLLSWLPYSHIYARTIDHYLTTIGGITVVLAESIETVVDNLREVRPTWLTAVPRFYEKVWASVEHLADDDRETALRDLVGPQMKQLTSGGAPLPRHVCERFFDAGIPLLEGYGLTESSPVISFNNRESYRIGTVGKPIGGVEVKIADDGEILTRGPHVMKGYWKNPQATAETIIDGWLYTGDVGKLDEDGFLTITDRKKDLFVTSAGKNIAPAELEHLLTSDEYIDQAIAYGDGRQFVSALVVPNFPLLDAKLDELNCKLEIEDECVRNADILDFYQDRVDQIMQAVSNPERVKRILLLARPFQVEDGELTATLKVRRGHIVEKYESLLAGLYDD